MSTRQFTTAELAQIGVPPADPEDVHFEDHLLLDEYLTTLKYSQQRRCIFRADDGKTYAIEYEARLDTGDFEVEGEAPPNNGWYGKTIEAVEVVQRAVSVIKWEPAPDEPEALDHLTQVYGEAGHCVTDARRYASVVLATHARELAASLLIADEELNDEAAEFLELYAAGLDPVGE